MIPIFLEKWKLKDVYEPPTCFCKGELHIFSLFPKVLDGEISAH